MKNSIFLLIVLSACSSLPKGNHELKQMINDDLPKQEKGINTYINKGRPIYLEAQSYPQIVEGGHINMGGKFYLFAGREELGLSDIIKYQQESEGTNNIIENDLPTNALPEKPELAEKIKSEVIFPTTAVTQSIEDSFLLKQSSIKKEEMIVINYNKCAKPKIDNQGSCKELKVSFDLSNCVGENYIQEGFQVKCDKRNAIFGIKKNNVRYRVTLNSNNTTDLWRINPKLNIMYIKQGKAI